MDAARFDALARLISTLGSRRRALGGALAGVLGALGVAGTEARKKKKKKPCPPCKKRKKGKCKAKLPDGTICAGGTCQDGTCAPASCSDGVKNASETGIDCGGPACPRCANGQGCTSRDDCRSSMCNLQINTCQDCQSSGDCGADSFGPCLCYTTTQGAKVCAKNGIPEPVTSCTLCPSTRYCVDLGGDLYCALPCGA